MSQTSTKNQSPKNASPIVEPSMIEGLQDTTRATLQKIDSGESSRISRDAYMGILRTMTVNNAVLAFRLEAAKSTSDDVRIKTLSTELAKQRSRLEFHRAGFVREYGTKEKIPTWNAEINAALDLVTANDYLEWEQVKTQATAEYDANIHLKDTDAANISKQDVTRAQSYLNFLKPRLQRVRAKLNAN